MDEAIDYASNKLGYPSLKEQQRHALKFFAIGNDVFVCLPTGYGKRLCFLLLLWVFDRLRGVCGASIVLCVSPLMSWMIDQRQKYRAMGMSVEIVGEAQDDVAVVGLVEKGRYQLVYVSPESLIGGNTWREMLRNNVYQENLVAFVVDEAHCVKRW